MTWPLHPCWLPRSKCPAGRIQRFSAGVACTTSSDGGVTANHVTETAIGRQAEDEVLLRIADVPIHQYGPFSTTGKADRQLAGERRLSLLAGGAGNQHGVDVLGLVAPGNRGPNTVDMITDQRLAETRPAQESVTTARGVRQLANDRHVRLTFQFRGGTHEVAQVVVKRQSRRRSTQRPRWKRPEATASA